MFTDEEVEPIVPLEKCVNLAIVRVDEASELRPKVDNQRRSLLQRTIVVKTPKPFSLQKWGKSQLLFKVGGYVCMLREDILRKFFNVSCLW